jgi:hypothetical protein
MAAIAHLQEPVLQPRSGIDHVVVPCRSYTLARRLYLAALEPLGFSLRMDWPDNRQAFFGAGDGPSLIWLAQRSAVSPVEVVLAAPSREAVDAFYAAALAAGALPRRSPEPYAELTAGAYGAGVADADGNVIEALTR